MRSGLLFGRLMVPTINLPSVTASGTAGGHYQKYYLAKPSCKNVDNKEIAFTYVHTLRKRWLKVSQPLATPYHLLSRQFKKQVSVFRLAVRTTNFRSFQKLIPAQIFLAHCMPMEFHHRLARPFRYPSHPWNKVDRILLSVSRSSQVWSLSVFFVFTIHYAWAFYISAQITVLDN